MDLIWITKAEYLKDYKIELAFNDGRQGVVDLEETIRKAPFNLLKDEKCFKSFQQNSWTIEWENGLDLAPEYLYNLVQN
ncbi:hypothetical protein CSB08_01495 [Candidatus Gracilibacteria bacterium]|nr:MAG: hypothetical protein CSB08_01495 [Candidatus Gracilibacteria bacterium]